MENCISRELASRLEGAYVNIYSIHYSFSNSYWKSKVIFVHRLDIKKAIFMNSLFSIHLCINCKFSFSTNCYNLNLVIWPFAPIHRRMKHSQLNLAATQVLTNSTWTTSISSSANESCKEFIANMVYCYCYICVQSKIRLCMEFCFEIVSRIGA